MAMLAYLENGFDRSLIALRGLNAQRSPARSRCAERMLRVNSFFCQWLITIDEKGEIF